ncbi:MAG: hypothetical protein IKX02_03370 [Spirochaetales bacterium]|nr:hypothetical protein [Spirochaetales bacterium]
MTNEEKQLMPQIATDLLTGNYLLYPRSEKQKELMAEFKMALWKVTMLRPLTPREKELIEEAAKAFYGGMPDMCDQLDIPIDYLEHLL